MSDQTFEQDGEEIRPNYGADEPAPDVSQDDEAPEEGDEPAPEPDRTYAGKYRSVDALEHGYDEANKAREAAQRELNTYRDRDRQRLEAEAEANKPDPLAPLLEGYDEEAQKLIKTTYEAGRLGGRTAAAEETGNLLNPLFNVQKAMAGFDAKDNATLQGIIAADSDFATRFNNLAAQDVELAHMTAEAAISLQNQESVALQADEEVRGKRARTRKDAGIVSKSGSGDRTNAPAKSAQEKAGEDRYARRQQAIENFQKTGDIRRLAVESVEGIEIIDTEGGRRKI